MDAASSSSTAQPRIEGGGPPPLDALKRFADDLKGDKTTGRPFLDINIKRVNAFIQKIEVEQSSEKNEVDQKLREKLADRQRKSHVFEYPKPTEHHKTLQAMQHLPETSRVLGVRSRFGEGDGSFFDRFISSDVLVTQPMPSNRRGAEPTGDVLLPTTGFRRHLTAIRTDNNSSVDSPVSIKPYAERRLERRRKEEAAARAAAAAEKSSEDDETHHHHKHHHHHHHKHRQGELTLPPLSESDKEKYFGEQGRAAFFSFYRQLSRQRLVSVSSKSDISTMSALIDDEPANEDEEDGDGGDATNDEMEQQRQQPHPSTTSADTTTLLSSHLALPPSPGAHRPTSARTRFIVACLDNDVGPRPGLIIRKSETSVLDLKAQRMGDDVAAHLAKALDALPMLQVLNVCDNNLFDPGLTAIIQALSRCPALVSVDISKNKIDDMAAHALSKYLSSRNCRLTSLVMAEADVDDVEASNFVQAVGVQNTILMLDMSRNLLGSHERLNILSNAIKTGGDSLGVLLSTPGCVLQTLTLAWNQIKRSGIPIALSLRVNASLTKLDLSYNGIDNEAAVCLGSALALNTSLVELNLAQNKVQTCGIFTLISGARRCHTLRILDLSGNAIGELGAQCVMALSISLGKGEISIPMQGCSLKSRDPLAWFNPAKPEGTFTLDLSKDYDRAVCAELLNIVAERDDYEFSDFRIVPAGTGGSSSSAALAMGVEFAKRRAPKISRKRPDEVVVDVEEEETEDQTPVGRKDLKSDAGEGEDAEVKRERKSRRKRLKGDEGGALDAADIAADANADADADANADIDADISGAGADAEAGAAEDGVPNVEDSTPVNDNTSGEGEGEGEGDMNKNKDLATPEAQPTKVASPADSKGEREAGGPTSDEAKEVDGEPGPDEDVENGKEKERNEDSSISESDSESESDEEAVVKPREMSDEEKLTHISSDIDRACELFTALALSSQSTTPPTLTRSNLSLLLTQLGLSQAFADDNTTKMLAKYDLDNSGGVELGEFSDFLQGVHINAQRSAIYAEEVRFLILKSEETDPRAKAWKVPESGVVMCTVSVGHSEEETVQTISSEALQGLIAGLASMSDASAMLTTALQTMRLRVPEAQQILRALLKEGGNALQALKLLLPRMATSEDTLALLALTPLRLDDSLLLKQALGWNFYRACTGLLSGFYSIALDNEADRAAFIRLVDASRQSAAVRQRKGLGDTSQAGDWNCFRNVTLNGKDTIITGSWLEKIPTSGLLAFDFVHLKVSEDLPATLSYNRFVRLLQTLRIVSSSLSISNSRASATTGAMTTITNTSVFYSNASKFTTIFDSANVGAMHEILTEEAHGASQCTGERYFQCSPTLDDSASLAITLARLYDNTPSRIEGLVSGLGLAWQQLLTSVGDVEMAMIEAGGREKEKRMQHIKSALSSQQQPLPPSAVEPLTNYMTMLHLGLNNNKQPGNSASTSDAPGTDERVRLLGLRCLTVLIDAFTGRSITCAMLSVLASVLPGGEGSLYPPISPPVSTEEGGSASAEEEKMPARGEEGEDAEYVEPPAPTEEEKLRTLLESASKAAKEAPLSIGTIRVELIVSLFSSLADAYNFEIVLKPLTPAERAAVTYRLGYLNIFCPTKPEGGYHLSLSRREEKQVFRLLAILSVVENPGGGLQKQCYQIDGVDSPRPEKPWTLPASWLNEATLPNKGVVSFCYTFSPEGAVAPNNAASPAKPSWAREGYVPAAQERTILTGMVHPKPTPEALSGHPMPSLANCETIAENAGLNLTFDYEKQKVTRGRGPAKK